LGKRLHPAPSDHPIKKGGLSTKGKRNKGKGAIFSIKESFAARRGPTKRRKRDGDLPYREPRKKRVLLQRARDSAIEFISS